MKALGDFNGRHMTDAFELNQFRTHLVAWTYL